MTARSQSSQAKWDVCFGPCIILLWLAINAADGVWIYYYVRAMVDPNPHTGANKTHSGFVAYEVLMFIFGFFWSGVNVLFVILYFVSTSPNKSSYHLLSDSGGRTFKRLFDAFIILPISLFFILMPAFGGWIVTPIARKHAWNHRCDSYDMFAVLDGRGYKNPSYTPQVVHFYQNTDDQPQLLFTYDVNSDSDSDLWTFALREFDVSQSVIPLHMYPTLQSVHYDFINDTLNGNCTLPVAPGASITNSTECMTGTFNPGNWLSFNTSSTVPLNTTLSSDPLPHSVRTWTRAVDKEWFFGQDQPPSFILKTVDPLTDTLLQTVVRTAVIKPGDCTQLKVCIGGTGQPGGLVGAEVMAPLGLLMINQADYAYACTTPSDN